MDIPGLNPPPTAPRTRITMTSAGPASSSSWCPSALQSSSCSTCCLPATVTYCTRPLPTWAAGRRWTQRCAPTCCSTRESPCPSLPNPSAPGQCPESLGRQVVVEHILYVRTRGQRRVWQDPRQTCPLSLGNLQRAGDVRRPGGKFIDSLTFSFTDCSLFCSLTRMRSHSFIASLLLSLAQSSIQSLGHLVSSRHLPLPKP